MKQSKQNKTNNSRRIVALTVVAALVLAACSAGDSDNTASAPNEDAVVTTTGAPAPEAGNQGNRTGDGELGSGGIGQPVQAPIPPGRDIIFTATMSVSVDDVAAAGNEAAQIVESLGGFIFGQQTVSDPEPATVLVFKVPPPRFQEALAALGSVGELRTQEVSADDVTDRIVDLESRIATAQTSVARLRTLLEEASAIETITELEEQLLARETALEQLRGSLRTLENQVGLATITMTITQSVARPAIEVTQTAYVGSKDQGTSCPGNPRIRVVEGEMATLCLEIRNVGDTALKEVDVTDVVLGLELEDFGLIFGDLTAQLEPGQSVVLATALQIERTLRSQTRVTATPVNEDGSIIEGRTAANTSTMTLVAEDPGGIPGFSDGLERSWELLINVVKVLILAAGLALPFLWVIGLGWLYMRWRRRRLDEKRAALEAARPDARVPVTPWGTPADTTDEAGESFEDA